jgi:hypothetical protein
MLDADICRAKKQIKLPSKLKELRFLSSVDLEYLLSLKYPATLEKLHYQLCWHCRTSVKTVQLQLLQAAGVPNSCVITTTMHPFITRFMRADEYI